MAVCDRVNNLAGHLTASPNFCAGSLEEDEGLVKKLCSSTGHWPKLEILKNPRVIHVRASLTLPLIFLQVVASAARMCQPSEIMVVNDTKVVCFHYFVIYACRKTRKW